MRQRDGWYRLGQGCKRALDVALSVLGLLLLALPFALVALLIWKLRTMVDGAERQGLGVTVARGDPRITRVGRLLRDWGLDELPQLLNVLRGEMSLVGPRPTLPYQVARYDAVQRRRLLVRPGITSPAVVQGRNALSWAERIALDVAYVEGWSLWLDLRVLLRTLWAVLVTRRGLYGPGGVNDPFLPAPETATGPGDGGG